MSVLRSEVADVLACPRCHGDVLVDAAAVVCAAGHEFPVVDGVPIFTDAGAEVARSPSGHVSNQPPAHLVDQLTASGSPWLHLGAGATDVRRPSSIELETTVFPHTDVVGDAVALPFRRASLSGVLALNVFEHLEDPEAAVAELHRVLRAGAVVVVQTAFLQPLHADPGHFFNVTELGLRRWFRAFDVDNVTVPENFNPAYAAAWIASDLLWHAPADSRDVLAAATVADVAAIWREPGARQGPLYEAFLALPDLAQRVLAAGFQLVARRP